MVPCASVPRFLPFTGPKPCQMSSPIRCGNAQGCPLSPILFLFVGEALARLAQDAPEWEGVTVGGFEHFLSQFADDTTLFVKNFQNLPLMWSCVRKYERATGMKVNIKKTEGIRAGALRGEEYDWHANGDVRLTTRLEGGKVVADLSVGLGANIAWCKKGDYIISLGTPIGDDFSLDRFWESKMNKTKRVMAGWHDINNVTPYGRALLANTSYTLRRTTQ